MSHLPRLKDHQLALLRRVADGPPVTSVEWTLATSVYGLRNRKLVTTPRSGGVWTAVITDGGRYYLEHGDYPPSPPGASSETEPITAVAVVPRSPRRAEPPSRSGMGGPELVARLVAENGQITIVGPDRAERHRWRRAIHQATSEHLAPAGQRITHSGRDNGDLVIRLEPLDPPKPPKPPLVPVPERLGRPHPVIAATRQNLDRYKIDPGMIDTRRGSGVLALKASRATLPRVLRIANALFGAAELRGLTVNNPADGRATIGAKGHHYQVTISEITQRRPYQHTKAEIERAARYGYEPYPRHKDVPTGDLQVVLPQAWGHTPALRCRWRDNTRRKIEDTLGEVLDGIETRIDLDEQRRLEAEHQAALRREAEQRAYQHARLRWIEDQRAKVLVRQVESWIQAGHIRAWIAAVETDRPEPDPALAEWLAWASAYAERIDTSHQTHGSPHIPEPQPEDLRPHLPRRSYGNWGTYPALP